MKPKFRFFRPIAKTPLAPVIVCSLAAASAVLADTTWDGSESSDWFDANNWNNGVPAGGGGVVIIPNAGTAPILTGSSTIDRLAVSNGTLTVNGGALETTTSTGNWWSNYGIGIENGTVALASGTITTNREVWVGYWGGTGTWTQTGGTANINSLFAVGNYEDVQGLTTGHATIENGTLNANEVSIARALNSADVITATMTVNGGGIVNSKGNIHVGFAGSGDANGTLTINNGGVVNAGTDNTAVNDATVFVGRWDAVDGTLIVNAGGTLNLQHGTDLRANNSGTKIITVDGGMIDGDANSTVWLGNSTTTIRNGGTLEAGRVEVGTATLTIGNGVGTSTLKAVDGLDSWEGSTTLNTGGVVEAAWIASGSAGNNGHFHADGGTVRATRDQGGFINYWGAGAKFKIEDGGVTIDNAGFDISVGGSGMVDGNTTGGTVILVGTGTTTFASNNTYTGETVVSAGTLFVSGAIGTGNVSVASDGTIGGGGSLGGDLSLDAGAKFLFSETATLSVAGTVSLASSFGVDDLVGLSASTEDGTYTLIDTTGTDFSSLNIENWGEANKFTLGANKFAWFEQGSLTLVVVPEPGAALLGSIGMLALLRRRRNG